MERAVQRREHREPCKADAGQGDQPRAGRLPRHHRQERHRPAPRVPHERLRVPGRQEHARSASRSRGRRWRGSRSCFVGPTAIAYSFEDPAAPAKIATKVAKDEEKFVIKGGYVDGKVLDAKGVEALVEAAGQGRAPGDFPCDFCSPAAELPARSLTAAQQNFAYLLAARERPARRRRQSEVGDGGISAIQFNERAMNEPEGAIEMADVTKEQVVDFLSKMSVHATSRR